MLNSFLLVGAGGFLGACSRFAVNLFAQRFLYRVEFPTATLFVNFVGSFLAGVLLAVPLEELPINVRLIFFTGFLGAFTTFSAFSVDTILLFQASKTFSAFLNIALNIIFSIGGSFLGFIIMQYFLRVYGR